MKSAVILSLLLLFLLNNNDMITSQQDIFPADYQVDEKYDKNQRPSTLTDVFIGLYINRISAVDENKEEISFDVFLQVIWEDKRIRPKPVQNATTKYTELKIEERHKIWVPDLYIRQLREMKLLKLFEEISSLRLYQNSTIALSIGATIIIKCDMDFVLYPLDVQKCPVDFSSYKYSSKDMTFRWKATHPITYPNDFGDGFFRLPKYVVSFTTEQQPHIVNYGDGKANHASARLEITLSREVKSYLLENYLPSTLFVSMSWGSFVVVPEVVPGRMVLLVTTLLSLITMFDTVRNNSPDALELKCLEVWLISCTMFVFLALMEYFIVLFGIRYDKHWRTSKSRTTTVSSPINLAASGMSSETPLTSVQTSQRRNGVDHATKMFNFNKVKPEAQVNQNKDTASTVLSESILPRQPATSIQAQPAENITIERNPGGSMNRRRFRNVAEYALLYAGSQRGKLDQISLVLFPLSFLVFAVVYWVLYLSESRKKI